MALLKHQKEVSKHVPLHRLLQIKKDHYTGESGQDYCPFSIETAILERKESLGNSQLAAVKRWEKTFANYEALGLGGMSPPPPKVIEQPKLQFIIQF